MDADETSEEQHNHSDGNGHTQSSSGSARQMDPRATIVLIGFRGIGKSTLGLIIATHLGRSFIDADRALSRHAGCSPTEYVLQHSWEKFRDLETSILRRLLGNHPQGYVIACGGGVVERAENRDMLQSFGANVGPVVHITREKEEVIKYLINEKDRPQWGEDMRTVWTRRYPLFEACSTHTYASLTVRNSLFHPKSPSLVLKDVEKDFIRFIRQVTAVSPIEMPPTRRRSYSLTLDCPVPQDIDYRTMDAASAGVDALELHVDSIRRPSTLFRTPTSTPLDNPGCPDHAYVAFAVAHLRRISLLPIIYTIRTVKAGGFFVLGPETEDDYFSLALCAFRLGIEYLDIESDIPQGLLQRILGCRPPNTRLILSYVDTGYNLHWHDTQVAHQYLHAQQLGADIARIKLTAETAEDNVKIEQFLKSTLALTGSSQSIPVIASNSGKQGHMSMLFNEFLTPVSHPAIPHLGAVPRGSFADVQRTLASCGMLPERSIGYRRRIGTQDLVDHRPILRAGMRLLGLPHQIEGDVAQEERQQNGSHSATLSGALVSLPLPNNLVNAQVSEACDWVGHVDVIALSDASSSAASAHDDPVQYHNVRASAIAETLAEGLSPINAVSENSTALLVGATGAHGREAAYALKSLGFARIVCIACDHELQDGSHNSSSTLVYLEGAPSSSPHMLKPRATAIVSFSARLGHGSGLDAASLSLMMASPTGGTLLELDSLSGPSLFSHHLQESGKSDAWVCLARQDVELQVVKKEFALVTGRNLPLEAFVLAR